MSLQNIKTFFSSSDFMPKIDCYLAKSSIVWAMLSADTLIGLAYVSISLSFYLLIKKIHLPLSPMFFTFGLFILASGITHFMEVYTLWIPAYGLSAFVKIITAIISLLTVIYLIKTAPNILLFSSAVSESHLKGINLATQSVGLAEPVRELHNSQDRFQLMVEGIKDYAIFLLDKEGRIQSWNEGAKQIKQYEANEIIGKHFSIFYTTEDKKNKKPERELIEAIDHGRFEDEGWRVRKDGSQFWANVIITPLKNAQGALIGFSKITRDLTERKKAEEDLKAAKDLLEQRVREQTKELRESEAKFRNLAETTTKELNTFSYSVAHDLRTPLRSIDGFSRILLTEAFNSLDEKGKDYLKRIRANAQKMGLLIDALLNLTRISRAQMKNEIVDLSSEVKKIFEDFQQTDPKRLVHIIVAEGVVVHADSELIRIVLQNLISNAWKFTSKKENPTIEFGVKNDQGTPVYFIRDTGVGFDMAYIDKLFGVFQRLHSENEFEGTGIGLATVQRIIHRHYGRVWGESEPSKGATFFFTLKTEDEK